MVVKEQQLLAYQHKKEGYQHEARQAGFDLNAIKTDLETVHKELLEVDIQKPFT